MRRSRRIRQHRWEELDEDPGTGLLNLFDVWIAFAVVLLLAMVNYMQIPELMSDRSDLTLIKNPGAVNMEIIRKQGQKIEHYRATSQELTGEGERLGTAYRLRSGEVVYVPEAPKPSPLNRVPGPSAQDPR